MPERPFDNVKNQIGYCGLWCGSCIVGDGALAELTDRYRGLIAGYGIDDWGATGFDSRGFMKGLECIATLPICVGCRKGGGNEACRIRPCAQSRHLSSCNECADLASCPHIEELRKVRAGALRVEMIVEASGPHDPAAVREWTKLLRERFPYCVLEL
jgi:hypothetical protein